MSNLRHWTKLYVPQQMLGDVMAWLQNVGITGFTQYDAIGGWFDGQDTKMWIVEPVKVIEIWHNGQFDPAAMIPIGSWHSQSCVMWADETGATIEDCPVSKDAGNVEVLA